MAAKGQSLSEGEKAEVQSIFDQVRNSTELATIYDPGNYLNFRMLGSIYQAVGATGVKGAYDQATLNYQKALELNPLNPGLKLALGTVAFADGKMKEAKDYATEALALKPNYLDGLLFMSQILKSEGNTADALAYAKAALSLAPTDKDLIQYVNSLNGTPSASPSSGSEKTKQ